MDFEDGSSEAETDLTELSRDNPNVPVADPMVDISADRDGTFNFGGGNLGMPPSQLVIGFDGTDHNAAQSFADEAVRELARHWRIHEIAHPDQEGAFPLASCP